MAEPGEQRRLLYFMDPMCSWCWGFSPVIAGIAGAFADVPIRIVTGGLRAFETRPMDARGKAYVREHWQHVEAATGQAFDYAFFARDGFVYDTEPACRAVVAVRSIAPEAALGFVATVQGAFYRDNRDVTDAAVLCALAELHGIGEEVFLPVFRSPEIAEATRTDFRFSQQLGVGGFPTLVLQRDEILAAVTQGYQSFAELEPLLRDMLEG